MKHYNKKENIIELWQKMNAVKRETGHLNISDTTLRRILKCCGKKRHYKKGKKKNKKHCLKVNMVFFIIEKLTCDIIEHCKLQKAIELIKN